MHVETRSVCTGFTFGAENMMAFVGLICLPDVELNTIEMFLKQNRLFNVRLEICTSTRNFHILSNDLQMQLRMIKIAKDSQIINDKLSIRVQKELSSTERQHTSTTVGDLRLPRAPPFEWQDIKSKLQTQCRREIAENQHELFFLEALQNCLESRLRLIG